MNSASDHGSYHKTRFDAHVSECDGKNEPKIKLLDHARPYVPHLLNNKLYAFLYANERLVEYRFIGEYITYDFETVTKLVGRSYGKTSFQDSTLHPLSVAWTIHTFQGQHSEFLYRDVMDEYEFVDRWLNELFTDALEIHKSREDYL
jgi:hypothetical protein